MPRTKKIFHCPAMFEADEENSFCRLRKFVLSSEIILPSDNGFSSRQIDNAFRNYMLV